VVNSFFELSAACTTITTLHAFILVTQGCGRQITQVPVAWRSVAVFTRILTLVKLRSLREKSTRNVCSSPYTELSTMLNRSKMFSSDSKRTKDNPDSLDDASAATPPWGSKARRNDSEMTSKVLKFRFVVSTSSNRQVVAPSVVHTHWMQAVQEVYGRC
jgi:hypothetical protein